LTDEGHYRRFRSRCCQSAHGRSRPSGRTRKALHNDGGTVTPHRRRGRKSSRQRGMSKALHDVEGTEVPMFSRAGRGRKSSCSLGQSEVLVVSGHRKTSRSGAHRYVNLSRLAGIVDLAVGGRIPSSCKPPSRRISVSTFAQGSRTHRNLNECSRIHHGGI